MSRRGLITLGAALLVLGLVLLARWGGGEPARDARPEPPPRAVSPSSSSPQALDTSPSARGTASLWMSGRVVDARTGEPVAQALVLTWEGHWKTTRPEVYTRLDGRFSLESLDSKGVRLLVQHPLYPYQKPVAWAPGQGELTVRLEPGASLEGRVESDGKPVQAGTVQLSFDGEPVATADVWQGHYALRLLPAGRYLVRVLGPRDAGPALLFPSRTVELASGARETLDFRERLSGASVEVLVPEGTVEVYFVHGDLPLLGPKQGLYNRLRAGFIGKRVQDGVRRFPQLPAGPYTLVAVHPDETGTEVHVEEVEVPAEGELSLTLLPQWNHFDD